MKSFILSLVFLSFAVSAMPPDDPTWQKRQWIDKTSRLLRGGQGLSPADDLNKWLGMKEEDIAREMMSDPRFADTVLDFNMYFLGFRADKLREADGSYTSAAFEMGNAIRSTQALLKNGDYLKLFDLNAGYFMPALDEDDDSWNNSQGRKETVAAVKKVFDDIIKYGATKPSGADFCKKFEKTQTDLAALAAQTEEAFENLEIIFERGGALIEGIEDVDCSNPSRLNVKQAVEEIKGYLENFNITFGEFAKYDRKVYNPKSIADFRPYDLKKLPTYDSRWISFSNEQDIALANSSTNMNRKRSAYALKTFFCDDLTPVGFEDPGQHTGGQHGSQTTCYACHYKLDPMAGFFREFGGAFGDYKKSDTIAFDDEVEVKRPDYDKHWKKADGTWHIGYVRSPDPRFDSNNIYGESLEDFTKMLRTTPEVKRCMIKKLFSYMIAENQAIDGHYLDQLARKFDADAAHNSSDAIKNAMLTIVQSNTFKASNPEPQRCYDFGPAGPSPNAPPCRVASILENNCKSCHSSTFGAGGLDLTSWIKDPSGKYFTFPHVDHDGKQREMKDTFARVTDRLSTSDPARRMPKGGTMPAQERQELYLWAQEQLAQP